MKGEKHHANTTQEKWGNQLYYLNSTRLQNTDNHQDCGRQYTMDATKKAHQNTRNKTDTTERDTGKPGLCLGPSIFLPQESPDQAETQEGQEETHSTQLTKVAQMTSGEHYTQQPQKEGKHKSRNQINYF